MCWLLYYKDKGNDEADYSNDWTNDMESFVIHEKIYRDVFQS